MCIRDRYVIINDIIASFCRQGCVTASTWQTSHTLRVVSFTSQQLYIVNRVSYFIVLVNSRLDYDVLARRCEMTVSHFNKGVLISANDRPRLFLSKEQFSLNIMRKVVTSDVWYKFSATSAQPGNFSTRYNSLIVCVVMTIVVASRVETVSYTHLDVYKRQERKCN